MAQKDQELIFKRAPYVDIVVGTGPAAPGARAGRRSRSRHAASRWQSASAARTAPRDEVERSFESYDPLRDPDDAADAVPGVRPHHDRLRQVLHLLHRAQRPRPRAEPAARADPRRGPATRRRGLQGNHAARPDGQQLQATATAAARRGWRPARRAFTTSTGIERIKFVTNYPEGHDRRPARTPCATCPRCCKYLHVPAQSGCERRAEADEARLHGRGLPRDARPHAARRCPASRSPATSSSASAARRRKIVPEDRATWSASRRFKNSFIFKYSARPGTKADELYADDVPEEVKRRRNNELLALQNQISEEDNHAVPRPARSRCSSKARARRRADKHGDLSRRRSCLQLTGRTHCDRIVVFDGNRAPDRPIPAGRRLRRQRPHAIRRGGDAARRPGGVWPRACR